MNPIPQRIINFLLITIGAGVVAMGVGARWYIDGLETARKTQAAEDQNAQAAQLRSLQEGLSTVTHAVDVLVAANRDVAAKLADEKTKRIAAESRQAADQQKLGKLQQDLADAKQPDLSATVAQWRSRVAQVRCRWEFANGDSLEGAGSGVLMESSPVALLTNRHVVTYTGITATRCTIKFPDETIFSVVTPESIDLSPNGEDWARVILKDPSGYVRSLASQSVTRCSTKTSVGAPIVILGYPTIGARDDVTATEGIISALEGSYYISSAKVERGNSGGAAILAKSGCYLGIPTSVDAGQLETLARILDVRVITK